MPPSRCCRSFATLQASLSLQQGVRPPAPPAPILALTPWGVGRTRHFDVQHTTD